MMMHDAAGGGCYPRRVLTLPVRPSPSLDALCQRHGVQRLDLFGSAARGRDFDPAHSDIDLLVEYRPDATPTALDFATLRGELAELFGTPVDLTMASALRNPYLRATIDADRVPLFGA